MKKLDEEKKGHSATLLFHSELEHVQKLSESPGPRLPPRKTLVPPCPEEDGVIKIFKSTLQGFRYFERIYVLKGQRGYTLHNFHKKSENVYYYDNIFLQ